MADPFTDRYWVEEFQVTEADLRRIRHHIRDTGRSRDLTALARRIIRGRLRHGPEKESVPVQRSLAPDSPVRLWDPTKTWVEGDHVIVAVGFTVEGRTEHQPFVGEVTLMESGKVTVRIDALRESRTYSTVADPDSLRKWRRFVQDMVIARRDTRDVASQTEYVLLEHGERVVSQLIGALRVDLRFIRLAGRWFLRELAVAPSDEQLASLAWAMVPLQEPAPTADLVALVQPPLAKGDAGLYGLYLAMRDSALFENADPGKRPRWVLSGPPPGGCTPQHAAYDPDSYEVLCLPGEHISAEVVEQLWDLELLQAVVGAA